jgi:hypothetical protein
VQCSTTVPLHRFHFHVLAGAQSFADLACVDGHIYDTFRQACEAWGLYHDDSEWVASFQEMLDVRVMTLAETRRQFALMLLNLPAANSVAMFNHFSVDLCGQIITPQTTASALNAIQLHMHAVGRSLADDNFGFDLDAYPNVQPYPDADSDYLPAAVLECVDLPSLSQEQMDAKLELIDLIDTIAENPTRSNVVAVVARAGTGKSIWVHHIAQELRRRNETCICVAASALAATVLPAGQTAHAAFNIPVPCHENTWLIWNDATKRRIRRARVIFWDEVSMVSVRLIDAVSRSLQQLMKNELLFGGKVMCFLGDFRQLAPVDKTGDGAFQSVTRALWFQSALRISFTFNYRASRDPEYAAMLEQVGDGLIEDVDVPKSCIVETADDLISSVYADGVTCYDDNNMILAMTLDQCALINDAAFEKIPGSPLLAVASDDLRSCKSPDMYPPEYIASLNFGGVPPAILKFKKHARFMIIKNYSPPDVCNGVLCELLVWSKFNVQLRLLSGPGKGRIVMLPRCHFNINESESGLPFPMRRWQFPMVPAYAVTIHKSQGQTLGKVGLFVEADAFAHGLIYVAMSRVSSWASLFFYSPEGRETMHNKVCKHLLPLPVRNYSRM